MKDSPFRFDLEADLRSALNSTGDEVQHMVTKGDSLMAKSAPPCGDVGTTSGTSRATQASEAAFRSRLSRTGVYKAPAGTGSSKNMPPSTSSHDSGRRLGGDSGPTSFTKMKT